MREKLPAVAWFVGVVLGVCAIADAALAAASVYTNENWARPLAWLAMFVGMGLCLAGRAGRAAALIGVGAAAAAIADLYTLDTYFFPDTQRFAAESGGAVYAFAAATALAGLLALRFAAAAYLVGVLLPVLAFSSLSVGLH